MAKRKKKFRINWKRFSVFLLLIICIIVAAIYLISAVNANSKKTKDISNANTTLQTQPVDLSIMCVGDIMVHEPQLASQYDSETGKYSYDNNFKYVKPYIKGADLALCNVETTFAGKPYTGYPTFSAPETLATAIKNAGFDIAITSNNHMMDKGLDGVKRTLKILRENKLETVGSILTQEEKRYAIKDVKGVKVGVVSYTYENGTGEGSTSINGNPISDEAAASINSFNFNTLDEDLPKMKEVIKQAKDAGAEIVVAYFHWGEEYEMSSNDSQKDLAKKIAASGADVIFASHPHVLQETDVLTVGDTGKKVPVFYSMGNFLSNQRSETLNNRHTEQGVMAKVNLTYEKNKGITNIALDGIPTWVDKYSAGGKDVYEIVPLDDKISENKALATSGHLSRAEQALEDANGSLKID
ncbi:MAG: CapA family protein [Anaerovoracaceae bacterium]